MLRLGKVTLNVTPKQLGASAYVGDAIKHARVFAPGANVPLKVAAPRQRLERYAQTLAKRFDRAAVDSELNLRNSKPFVTKEQQGRRLRQSLAVRDLYLSLKTHTRDPIVLKQDVIKPESTRDSFGSVIVIRRGLNKLFLYDGMKLRRDFGVATGQSRYPTPLGKWEIVVKWRNPWWYPPLIRLGEGRGADSARPGQPPRHALDGPLCARRRHPRHSRSRFDRLLGLARLHPDADSRGRVALHPGRHRHAGLHPAMTGRLRLGGQVVAVAVVAALLGLLAWKLAQGESEVTSEAQERRHPEGAGLDARTPQRRG